MRHLEQELQLSHQRCAHYRACLQSAVEQLAAMRGAATLDPHQLHELEEWLQSLEDLPERTTPAGYDGVFPPVPYCRVTCTRCSCSEPTNMNLYA